MVHNKKHKWSKNIPKAAQTYSKNKDNANSKNQLDIILLLLPEWQIEEVRKYQVLVKI